MISEGFVLTVLYGVIAGGSYGLIFYAKKARRDSSTSFDIKKFAKALIIGGIVGGASAVTGTSLTEQSYQSQVLSYGFATVLADQLTKIVWKKASSD